MKRRSLWGMLASLLGLGFAAGPVSACLWDRDTLDVEARGLPEAVSILTGRFERNPPLYYQMRLDRVAREIAAHPDRLDLYDDAAVASDRLRRHEKALAWMRKKRAAMGRVRAADEDFYRYHANLGTFLAHRWLRSGADGNRLTEVEAARREVARALQINPEAHFGREKYQLAVLDWILQLRKGEEHRPGEARTPTLGEYLLRGDPVPAASKTDSELEPEAAVRGLTGLIALGDAWESVDVFDALRQVLLRDQKASVALLAGLRAEELLASGRHPLGSVDRSRLTNPTYNQLTGAAYSAASRKFRELRAEADAWHRARTDFMLGRLTTGSHPDTDPGFWSGFRSVPPPGLGPSSTEWLQIRLFTGENVLRALLIVLAALPVVHLVRRARRKRLKTATAPSAESS